MKQDSNLAQYSVKLLAHIQEMFNDDCENHISLDDFQDDSKLKDFLHAISNIAPTMIYNQFTGSDSNNLEFNHIANRLCFEYMNKK